MLGAGAARGKRSDRRLVVALGESSIGRGRVAVRLDKPAMHAPRPGWTARLLAAGFLAFTVWVFFRHLIREAPWTVGAAAIVGFTFARVPWRAWFGAFFFVAGVWQVLASAAERGWQDPIRRLLPDIGMFTLVGGALVAWGVRVVRIRQLAWTRAASLSAAAVGSSYGSPLPVYINLPVRLVGLALIAAEYSSSIALVWGHRIVGGCGVLLGVFASYACNVCHRSSWALCFAVAARCQHCKTAHVLAWKWRQPAALPPVPRPVPALPLPPSDATRSGWSQGELQHGSAVRHGAPADGSRVPRIGRGRSGS
jgi:hypothetical protein